MADRAEEVGFTLIELLVNLLILLIPLILLKLLAIAIPTFLGVTGGAGDMASQPNLNTALTAAKTYAERNGRSHGNGGGGAAPTTTQMTSHEPSPSWVSGATSTQGAIPVRCRPTGRLSSWRRRPRASAGAGTSWTTSPT